MRDEEVKLSLRVKKYAKPPFSGTVIAKFRTSWGRDHYVVESDDRELRIFKASSLVRDYDRT